MQPHITSTLKSTVRQRYDRLLRAGFSPKESASLIAKADGIDRHGEGEAPSGSVWRWQEITGLEFVRYLVRAGRIGGSGRTAT